jgi:heme/copper-type cytochrome/quinol oxidase subunit 4
MNLLSLLDGKKTYLVAFVLAALNLAVAFGVVSPQHLDQINVVLVALGFGAVRNSIK